MFAENNSATQADVAGFLKKKEFFIVLIAVLVWGLAHGAGIAYGTHDLPLHQSYVGDEQSPVNGALHMLESHNPFYFGDHRVFYYGPVFALIDTPGIAADFGSKYVSGLVHSAQGYRNYILYDWGGIVFNIRLTAVLASILGLYAAYCLMRTRTMNPSGRKWLPYLSVGLVAVNFYFFEYSHFAKHWAFIIPLILLQYYSFIRISETGGAGKKYWLLHSAATVLIFGISYVGILSLLMWLPWLIGAVRRKDRALLRTFACYSLLMLAGFLLMVAWYPYPFIRDISFLGVGTPKGGMDTTQNPLFFAHNSLLWYGTEIVLNNLALVLAFTLLLVVLFPRKIWRSAALWSLLAPALGFFLLFAPAQHHEGRYMLPTIVLLVLATGYLLSEYAAHRDEIGPEKKRPLLRTALATLLACYVAFQVVVDAEWIHIYANGPAEKQAVAEILDLQKTSSPVLVVQDYILGQAHDKASYKAYVAKSFKADISLYQAILASDPPASIPLLNVRYASSDEFAADPALVKRFPHAVVEYVPVPGQINQFDYFDEDLMLLWYYDDLSPSYSVFK